MKSVVSCFLALLLFVGSLVPQNDLMELRKLPQLLEHYRFHHSAAGGGLSVVAFLAEHYGAGTRHYAARCGLSPRHRHEHQGLPLRCQHGGAGVAFVLPPGRLALPVPAPVFRSGAAYGAGWVSGYAFGPLAALLQPPRA